MCDPRLWGLVRGKDEIRLTLSLFEWNMLHASSSGRLRAWGNMKLELGAAKSGGKCFIETIRQSSSSLVLGSRTSRSG